MKTIIHISDLHFGTEDMLAKDALIKNINRTPHDLLVVSGDFTQRALASQFRSANAFLNRLHSPKIVCVPGNHDIPLYNLLSRFFNPYKYYRKYINSILNPIYQDNELLILGINTSEKKLLIRGYINKLQASLIKNTFMNCNSDITKILFFHHNLIKDEYFPKEMIVNYDYVVDLIKECQIDLVLTGHLHIPHIRKINDITANRYTYEITAGTGISKRIRKVNNSYTIIEIDKKSVNVDFFIFNGHEFLAGERFNLDIA